MWVRGGEPGGSVSLGVDPTRRIPLDRGTAAREICLGLRAESVPGSGHEERLKPGHDLKRASARHRGSGCPLRATALSGLPGRVQLDVADEPQHLYD